MILFTALLLFGSLAIIQGIISRTAIAQQPNPTPTPKPGDSPPAIDSCCEIFTPGGQTIGGPGTLKNPGTNRIFESQMRARTVCLTIQNLEQKLPYFFEPINLRVEGFPDSRVVLPEQMRTICGPVHAISVTCDIAEGCAFRWRIDQVQ